MYHGNEEKLRLWNSLICVVLKPLIKQWSKCHSPQMSLPRTCFYSLSFCQECGMFHSALPCTQKANLCSDTHVVDQYFFIVSVRLDRWKQFDDAESAILLSPIHGRHSVDYWLYTWNGIHVRVLGLHAGHLSSAFLSAGVRHSRELPSVSPPAVGNTAAVECTRSVCSKWIRRLYIFCRWAMGRVVEWWWVGACFRRNNVAAGVMS